MEFGEILKDLRQCTLFLLTFFLAAAGGPTPPSPPEAKQPPPKKKIKPQLVRLEEELRRSLGTKVTIHESGGKGKITIEFYSNDDFDRIRSLLTDD